MTLAIADAAAFLWSQRGEPAKLPTDYLILVRGMAADKYIRPDRHRLEFGIIHPPGGNR